MPLYDFKCLYCGIEFEEVATIADRNDVKCGCGSPTKVLITNSKSQDWFKPHFNEHMGPNGTYITSRTHLKELCLRYNVTSVALGDVRDYTHRK